MFLTGRFEDSEQGRQVTGFWRQFNDAIVAQPELHPISRIQPQSVADSLWDRDLPFAGHRTERHSYHQ